jgi:RNA-directed DNA polymerase
MSAVKPFTIPKRLVSDAWKAVKANAGSAGVDKETMARASERDGVLS